MARAVRALAGRDPVRRTLGALAAIAALVVAMAPSGSAATGGTTRVSVDSSENQGNALSTSTSISSDGRYVAFASDANNLVPGDTNDIGFVPGRDVFVHDRQAGTTERVSLDTFENQANGGNFAPSISSDGRYVAFLSGANSLVSDDTNVQLDIFVRDRQAGTTERVSLDSFENQANHESRGPSISSDGLYVAFDSVANNLVGGDTNSANDIFVRNRQSEITQRVSIDGSENQGNNGSTNPSISSDGFYVAFDSVANNLVEGDTNGQTDVFVRDRQAGITERVSVDGSENQTNDFSSEPSISSDGRYVSFDSFASNLVEGDTNGQRDVFVRDRQAGTTERVSIDGSENEGNDESFSSSISSDGRYIIFESEASNLVEGDTNDQTDVFVRDRQAGTTERVSIDSSGNEGNGSSFSPSISSDGVYVAFDSLASNLVEGDTNGQRDVFVHERSITAPNQSPVIKLVNPAATANEGEPKLYVYTLDNTDGPPATVTPNCGSGQLKPAQGSDPPSSFRCLFPDGDTATTVSVTADDGQSANNTDSDSVGVTVSNVAPALTAASTQSATTGQEANLDMGSFTDPGTDGDWEVTVAWGDGSAHTTFTAASAGSLGQKPHTYATSGAKTVTVTVAETGGSPSDSETFQIAVQPTDAALPMVFSVNPLENQKKVLRTANITITFSEAMDTGSLNANTVKLVKVGKPPVSIPLTMQTSNNANNRTVLTLDPFGPATETLEKAKTYQVTVEGTNPPGDSFAVKDLAGNEMAENKVWSFKT